jgi:hypothetical protein
MVGRSRAPSSRDRATCPAAWNESSAIGHRSRKWISEESILSLPEEKEPWTKGWFETSCVDTRLAQITMKQLWTAKEMMRLRRRREEGGLERPVGYRCSALKKSAPRQKAAIAVSDL